MENETEQTPYREEPGFLKKHRGKIVRYTITSALIYAFTAFMSGMINYNTPARYEEFNPRRHEKVEKEAPALFKAVDYLAENFGDELMTITNAPWRAINMVTTERYGKIRKQAFEIAGIDEKNPEHDAKRFKFYRQLGIAVRETEDPAQAAYIPFEKLKEYIEKNSSHTIDKKWTEPLSENTYKGMIALQGNAYYKADDDKDGVVTDKEWKKALREMGYKSQDDVLEEITNSLYGKTKEELKTELEGVVKKSKENPDYLTGNIPKTVPTSKLKEYIKE